MRGESASIASGFDGEGVLTRDFAEGGYRYIPGVFQYSSGVAALPGYDIERVRLSDPIPLKHGFELIRQVLIREGRPLTALCACELRSPAPFTPQGFHDFNRTYVETLAAWGLYKGGKDDNPVARTNVCPELDPPRVPSLYAFSFTVQSKGARPSCVIAGSGEARNEDVPYEKKTVRYGESSIDAMREKARFVVAEIGRRLRELGFGWPDVTATQVYTVYDFHSFFAQEIVAAGAARHGATWHFHRPPVDALAFEMDCRVVARERVIGAG
jgi:hypothetical protein